MADGNEASEGDEGRDGSQLETTIDSALAASGAAIGLLDPTIGILAAGAAPWLRDPLLESIRTRVGQTEEMIEGAAAQARTGVEEFLEEAVADSARQRLLRRAIEAAYEAEFDQHLEAIAEALHAGVTANSRIKVDNEALALAALRDLGPAHVSVLKRFTQAPAELGIGKDREPVESLNRKQVDMVVPEIDAAADPILATLVRHGLLRDLTLSGGGGYGSGGPTPSSYQITKFGRAILARLSRFDFPTNE